MTQQRSKSEILAKLANGAAFAQLRAVPPLCTHRSRAGQTMRERGNDAERSDNCSFQDWLARRTDRAGEPAYDAARKVYNGMIDRRPRLIAHCADVADVIAAVKFAREHKLLVAVRGGGHNAGGLGVATMAWSSICRRSSTSAWTRRRRTVLVGGGALWGDVDHATHAFGLAVPAGIISTTGVGGLTLGGGLGHLTRQCGLTIDNLLAVDMVLADGRFVTASAKEHADLFWAVRGGGGNFGVVTSFLFRRTRSTPTTPGRCSGSSRTPPR